ncbi:MAG: ATP-binding protein [Rhodobacteraceae bacterium]|nr:ATP-binding protein [Paracoccaceae bacterium]
MSLERSLVAFALGVAVLTGAVWHFGYDRALDQLSLQAEADLALASDRLSAQLRRYRELAVLMADHPGLRGLEVPDRLAEAEALLVEVADKTGALDVMLVGAAGRVSVSARGPIGRDMAAEPAVRRAMQGALGASHGIDRVLARRAYRYASPVFDAAGKVEAALVVLVNVDTVEQTWRGSTPAVLFSDRQGEVFIANRSELLFWRRPEGQPGLFPPDGTPLPFRADLRGGHEIWRVGWGPYLPGRALHLARDLPVIGFTGEVLVDLAPARRIAALQAAAVAALCLAFGALLFLATERRRALSRANAVLESRVAARTVALTETNAALRREVAERQEAEAALTRAQAELVQAGKLSALGQMSAGISHELNQPLMAIQSFADNATQFLDRGRTDVAESNLRRISDLARRMGRIIRNLRAFARQESEAATRVNLVAVLDSALELVEARLAREGVALRWRPPPEPVWVRGGEVRLGQVFVNLITNAADAMAEQSGKAIRLTLIEEEARVRVEVADTGPGIAEPERMFDPFYTTKEVGASEGMGLGLSISYGLVQSFGGAIRGHNGPEGGAVMTVELERWQMEVAA